MNNKGILGKGKLVVVYLFHISCEEALDGTILILGWRSKYAVIVRKRIILNFIVR